MSNGQRWILVEQIDRTIGHLAAEEQLLVLDFAWLTVASIARADTRALAGGLTEEQARQIGQLQAMSEFVAADVPKLEMDSFEDDLDRLRPQLLQQLQDLVWPPPDRPTRDE